MAPDFFSRLVYAASNEDSLSELEALHTGPNDRILTITGSGARALGLLLIPSAEVVAIDQNPAQTHLLHLKIAAIQTLTYPQLLEFLGVTPSEQRVYYYQFIRPKLPAEVAAWWDHEHRSIRKGVLYSGTWEQYLAGLAQAGNTRAALRRRLFEARDLEEQVQIWEQEWDNSLWKSYLYLISRRWLWRYVLKEPGVQFIPARMDLGAILYHRFDAFAHRCLLRESDFAVLMFWGKYQPQYALPLYLQEQHLETMRQEAGRISAVTAPLDSYLKTPSAGLFDAFSLSDFSSYADIDSYKRTWHEVVSAAAPNARFCERQFLVPHAIPPELAPRVTCDEHLSRQLTDSDKSFIYTLRAGHITL
ncbi:MAG: DUF3419 family protein [Bacteroidetes bacterium]|nr:MAG: DUF3419 family protein [Bacteroidota bacterium]